MQEYYAKLESVNGTDFNQTLVFNTTQLDFRFYWLTDLQELCETYSKALQQRAMSDPWINDDAKEILRDYDWVTLYSAGIPHATQTEVEEWLETTDMRPQSLRSLTGTLLVTEIYERCKEADELIQELQVYYEQLLWHVDITDSDGNIATGVVRRGGWIENQSAKWRVQFEADSDIKYDNLIDVTINCEVPDNE